MSHVLTGILAAGCCAFAPMSQAVDANPGTIVFHDVHVFTADPTHPYAEALAIRGDRILAVGTLAAVEQAAGTDYKKVDLKGRFLMPGMIDSHAHPLSEGIGGGWTRCV